MRDKFRFIVIFLLKLLSVIFMVSAIASFITSIVYNIKSSNENAVNLFFLIFANLGVTLFYRIVMAIFFFAFAIFIEEWLKAE